MTERASLRVRLVAGALRAAARVRLIEPEVRGLGALVKPGDTVFDIGGAYGMYAFPLASLVGPAGRVHSFEPQARQYRLLRLFARMLGARNLTVTRAAIAETPGTLTIRTPIRFGLPIYGHAHAASDAEATGRMRERDAPVHTVDEWAADHGIDGVALIKADVEGYEPRVLDGAAATIARDLPAILLEIEDRHLARYHDNAADFASRLLSRWPAYRMHVWQGRWVPADTVQQGIRNHLFLASDH